VVYISCQTETSKCHGESEMKRIKHTKVPATANQVAMFGHVAATLREYMKVNNLTVRQFNIMLGSKENNTAPYMWLNAKAAPGPNLRPRVSQATGIPESDLLPRKAPSRRGKSLSLAPDHGTPMARLTIPFNDPVPVKVSNVLSFIVDDTNMATITVNAKLPLDVATPLLRMLLDAGVIFNKSE
jgi:hypothetical protein